MRLDDEQIERYSRQLILTEVGPRGQERLGAAAVAVVGVGIGAERVLAYLAAAGIGRIAADPALHAAVDPDQPDCVVTTLANAGTADARIVVAASVAEAVSRTECPPRAAMDLWIAEGLAGRRPPCPRCAAAAASPAPTPPELVALRDAFLGTLVATETVKALLALGSGFAGAVVSYDAVGAVITRAAAIARPGCDC